MRTLYDMYEYIARDFDVFTEYNVNEYLGSFGLAVVDEYKQCGIGREMLRTR